MVETEQLDLGRELAAKCPSGDAPPHRPPVPNRGGRHLYCQISALLCKDHAKRTKGVGTQIESKLTGGNVQEAFCHLKGWYRAESETQAKPCFYAMECQTLERVNLYARRRSPGYPLPINVKRIEINGNVPLDSEIWLAAGKLSSSQAAGASGTKAKHVKEWLLGHQMGGGPQRSGRHSWQWG